METIQPILTCPLTHGPRSVLYEKEPTHPRLPRIHSRTGNMHDALLSREDIILDQPGPCFISPAVSSSILPVVPDELDLNAVSSEYRLID